MRVVALGIILSCSTICVNADDLATDQKGWIVGAGLGTAMITIGPVNQPEFETTEENPTLLTVFGGYNFTNWFGIEFDISKSNNFTDKNTRLDADILGTSFTPKFTYHFNNKLDIYLKGGLQYIAYDKKIDNYYKDEITLLGVDTFYGAGLQYSFESGVRARLDYKYAKIRLDREETILIFDPFEEDIDLTLNALVLTVNYQF